jgi:hypothetical protein
MHKRFRITAALLALTGVALADTTCIVPTLSSAQLRETGDSQLNSEYCNAGMASSYESLMHMTGWSHLSASSCVGANWPKQRFLNTVRLLDKAEEGTLYSVDLDNGWELAQKSVSNKPGCTRSGDPWAFTLYSDKSTTYYWRFFYTGALIDRAATIIHEAAHSALGKRHIEGDITIIGTNSCKFGLKNCDTSWLYNGSWARETKFLEGYAAKGRHLTSPSARRLAQDVGNWNFDGAFVERPMLRGAPRWITCTGC